MSKRPHKGWGGGGLVLSIKEVGTEGMWEGAFFAFWW